MKTQTKHFDCLLKVIVAIVITGILFFQGKAFAQPDYSEWVDHGVVYSATAGDSYYPSVIYDAGGFGSGTPLYKMWYSDGDRYAYVVESSDGVNWSESELLTGLSGTPHHVQVLYDADQFDGSSDCTYKIWYWDKSANLYSINAIAYAESEDGISWTNSQAITQSENFKLVTGVYSDWNYGSYGPVDVLYRPGALNGGSNPWRYSYVMFYDGTNGGNEFTGLAYSENGFDWVAYTFNPVLDGATTAAWDCSDSSYGTVYRDAYGYHFWYSGGGADDGYGGCQDSPTHEGIGYAFSFNGKKWTKDPGNPIFHISDGVIYRNSRVYTPAVVDDDSGHLKMYYSAKANQSGSTKKIGLATLSLFNEVDIDINPRRYRNKIRDIKWLDIDDECDFRRKLRVAILTTQDFDALTVNDATVTFGDAELSGTATPVRSRARDVDRDGDKDLLLFFSLCELITNDALNPSSTEMVLKGKTSDGIFITGSDSVVIFNPHFRQIE